MSNFLCSTHLPQLDPPVLLLLIQRYALVYFHPHSIVHNPLFLIKLFPIPSCVLFTEPPPESPKVAVAAYTEA